MPLIKVLSTEPKEILSSQEFHSLWTVRVGLLLVGCVDDLVDAPGARERKIYLDRENSRPVSQATVEAMGPYFQDNKTYGNPTPYQPGWMAYASMTEEKLA